MFKDQTIKSNLSLMVHRHLTVLYHLCVLSVMNLQNIETRSLDSLLPIKRLSKFCVKNTFRKKKRSSFLGCKSLMTCYNRKEIDLEGINHQIEILTQAKKSEKLLCEICLHRIINRDNKNPWHRLYQQRKTMMQKCKTIKTKNNHKKKLRRKKSPKFSYQTKQRMKQSKRNRRTKHLIQSK